MNKTALVIIFRLMLLTVVILVNGKLFASPLKGIGFSLSRVVMMATGRGGAAVEVTNNTDTDWLMQSRILHADVLTGMPLQADIQLTSPPFLVLPPLQRLEANSVLGLRIVEAPADVIRLPKDRESVFFLSAKAIPSVKQPDRNKHGTGSVAIALINNIKLFYRPAGLQQAVLDDLVSALSVRRQGDRLLFINPSAYYITFASLAVNNKDVDSAALQAMIPPKGSQTYPFPHGTNGGDVSWALINEYGLTTKAQHQNVN
ncbi:molecular chaperone [Enterobacteriaceae bacterium LUAb1]